MEVKITNAKPEVVGTVHFEELDINLEVDNGQEVTDIKVALCYNDGGGRKVLTEVKVEDAETTLDCCGDDVITEVKKVFPDIDDEDFKKLGSLLDKKIDELLTKWEIHQE